MTDHWWDVTCAVASAAVAVVFLVAVVKARRDRSACSAHAAMGAGMVGMFVPGLDVVPSAAGVLAFALTAAWFAVRRSRADAPAGCRSEAAHLVIAPAAMALMYVTMAAAPGGMDMGSAAAMTTGLSARSPLLGGLSIALTGYFVWYAWVLVGRLTRGPSPDGVGGGRPAAVGAGALAVAPAVARSGLARVVTVAHIVMCVLMAVMFVGGLI